MYICQDKCYRLVPPQDHRYAQSKNYLRYARFCGICKVVYNKDTDTYKKMEQENTVLCPCCSAKTRGYFEVEKKREIWVWNNVVGPVQQVHALVFQSSETFKDVVDRVFRSEDNKEEETQKQKARKEVRKPVAAPLPKLKKSKAMIATKLVKLTMYPILAESPVQIEISMFPQH